MPEEHSVPQAASYLGVSEETVRRNIRSKRLKAIRRGTQWFVDQQELLAFAGSYDPRTGRVSRSHSDTTS
jgi:excisionase family DNA binding protein